MDSPLTGETIKQIIFAMEDQQENFLISVKTGEIVECKIFDPTAAGGEFLPVPEWKPLDGYALMEKFVSRLNNPVFKGLLREALDSGKNVFRNFKNTLKKNEEVEKLWFSFKEREMRKVVFDWYNEQRELRGLEQLGPEPEETEDLLLSDFIIREGKREDLEPLLRLDKMSFLESFPDRDRDLVEHLYGLKRKQAPSPLDSESLLLIAETPGEIFTGFAWGVRTYDPFSGGSILRLIQLAVVSHYRGLGLAGMLVKRFLEAAHERGYEALEVELAGVSLSLFKFFSSLGFKTRNQTLELDLTSWEREGMV